MCQNTEQSEDDSWTKVGAERMEREGRTDLRHI